MQAIDKSYFYHEYDVDEINKEREKQRNKWKWIILIGCFLFQMFPYCVAVNLTNVFVGSDWIHWAQNNSTIVGLTFTIGSIVSTILGPMIAKLFNKTISLRFIYSIGVITAMIGFIGISINALIPYESRSLPVVIVILWIFYAISQVGVMIFSGLGVNNLISTWWPANKRGVALGFAFAGGSLGNIWMQQLLGVLGKEFGNVAGSNYNENGQQWITYVILGSMGLVVGMAIVMFTCKKPLPSIDILGEIKQANPFKSDCVSCGREFNEKPISLQSNDFATFLDVKKYPVYWILAIGYLILEMGTVPASLNGLIISHSIIVAHPNLNYNTIMAIGGTLFGVSCLIGNFCGGILNDKLGPNKSIALAGSLQCLSIFCLMYGVKEPIVVYIYFFISGLSVYVYTSTPAFISGRLYGAKNSNFHMAILGIFVAFGFALVNSISGVIVGPTNTTNIHQMFGQNTEGNIFALLMFALICMGLGTIIVVWCSTIIMNKGIKGLKDYSPTKFSQIIFFKNSLFIKLTVWKILIKRKDFRSEENYKNKINNKKAKIDLNKSIEKRDKFINKANKKIAKNNELLSKKLNDINAKLNVLSSKSSSIKQLSSSQQDLINKKINKIDAKHKQELNTKQFNLMWNRYVFEYKKVEKIIKLKNKLTKYQDQYDAKIKKLNDKQSAAKYLAEFTNNKLSEGNILLTNYYSDVYKMCNKLISDILVNKISSKMNLERYHAYRQQLKYDEKIELLQEVNKNDFKFD